MSNESSDVKKWRLWEWKQMMIEKELRHGIMRIENIAKVMLRRCIDWEKMGLWEDRKIAMRKQVF